MKASINLKRAVSLKKAGAAGTIALWAVLVSLILFPAACRPGRRKIRFSLRLLPVKLSSRKLCLQTVRRRRT